MDAVLGPPGIDVAVVGALATEEQAQEALQMRFILAWNLHLARQARPQRGASASSPPR